MNVGRSRLWTCLALGIIIAAAAGSADAALFGLFKSKKKVANVPQQSLVVFPFDQDGAAKIPGAFGEFVASDLRTVLAEKSDYAVYLFKDRLPPIRRAKEDSTIKTADLEPPYAGDKSKALKLAQLLAADFFVIGEIDDYQMDRTQKAAEITLRADLYNARSGKLVKTFLVAGRTANASGNGDEDELRDMAKGDAVTKLMAQMMDEWAPKDATAGTAAPPAPSDEAPADSGQKAAEAPVDKPVQ